MEGSWFEEAEITTYVNDLDHDFDIVGSIGFETEALPESKALVISGEKISWWLEEGVNEDLGQDIVRAVVTDSTVPDLLLGAYEGDTRPARIEAWNQDVVWEGADTILWPHHDVIQLPPGLSAVDEQTGDVFEPVFADLQMEGGDWGTNAFVLYGQGDEYDQVDTPDGLFNQIMMVDDAIYANDRLIEIRVRKYEFDGGWTEVKTCENWGIDREELPRSTEEPESTIMLTHQAKYLGNDDFLVFLNSPEVMVVGITFDFDTCSSEIWFAELFADHHLEGMNNPIVNYRFGGVDLTPDGNIFINWGELWDRAQWSVVDWDGNTLLEQTATGTYDGMPVSCSYILAPTPAFIEP